MYVDRVIFPINSLGPGNRIVIWVSGCSKHCKECANPELWEKQNGQLIEIDILIKSLERCLLEADGVTITGGDPCEQFSELMLLTSKLKKYVNDIIVYTGYTYDELKHTISDDEWEKLHQNVNILIDGRYISQLNDSKIALRGSTNQNIIYLNADDELREKYSVYLLQGRTVQNVVYNNSVISVGIHNKSYEEC